MKAKMICEKACEFGGDMFLIQDEYDRWDAEHGWVRKGNKGKRKQFSEWILYEPCRECELEFEHMMAENLSEK